MYVYAIPNNTLITAPCIKYISKEYLPKNVNNLLLFIGRRHNEEYINKPTTRLKAIIPNGNQPFFPPIRLLMLLQKQESIKQEATLSLTATNHRGLHLQLVEKYDE